MCLNFRLKHREPYNNLKTRWKFVVEKDDEWRGLYQTNFSYVKQGWNVSKQAFDAYASPGHDGFHVFATRADARAFLFTNFPSLSEHKLLLKKVQVSGFKKSGTFCRYRSETWDKMKFIK